MRTIARWLLFSLSFLLLPALAPAQQVSLTILHTNDTHGHLLPFSYPSVVPADSDLAKLEYRTNIGGIARRATLVKRIRAELEKKGTTVWLMDAGDFSDGTPFSSEYHGEADIAAMNATGYNFATLGNHEFNNSLSRLEKVIGLFRFPLICANATLTATGKPLVAPFVTREVGPLKIGIFGLVTHGAATYAAAKEGVSIADEIVTARSMVKQLRAEADIVIALSHSGDQTDERMAEAVPNLDVIVGGHSHSRLPIGQLIYHSDELKADEVSGTIIVQAFQWGGELGRLDLLFTKEDSGWHVDRYRARLLPVTSEIPEDAEVAAVVDRYWKPIESKYGKLIGKAAADFAEQGDDLAQYNLVADAVRESYGTEIEFENLGGVRAPLLKGNITWGDLIQMDPFDNRVVTFRITGRELKNVLLKNRPAVSGIRYRIENRQLKEVTVGGKPVDDDRIYSGTTNSYFAGVALKGVDRKDTGRLRLDVIIDYIRRQGTITPVYDGRRVVTNN